MRSAAFRADAACATIASNFRRYDRWIAVVLSIGTARTRRGWPRIRARGFPSRAITIINAFPPGGVNDIVTRPLAAALEPILKQPVVVETKAGAAGQVGAQVAASAKPDGYTLAVAQHRHLRLRGGRQAVRAAPRKPRAPISFRWRG